VVAIDSRASDARSIPLPTERRTSITYADRDYHDAVRVPLNAFKIRTVDRTLATTLMRDPAQRKAAVLALGHHSPLVIRSRWSRCTSRPKS
jgi:hypothetical protein